MRSYTPADVAAWQRAFAGTVPPWAQNPHSDLDLREQWHNFVLPLRAKIDVRTRARAVWQHGITPASWDTFDPTAKVDPEETCRVCNHPARPLRMADGSFAWLYEQPGCDFVFVSRTWYAEVPTADDSRDAERVYSTIFTRERVGERA